MTPKPHTTIFAMSTHSYPTFHTNAYHTTHDTTGTSCPPSQLYTPPKHASPCYTFVKPECYKSTSVCEDTLTSQHKTCQAVLLAPAHPSYARQFRCRVHSLLPACTECHGRYVPAKYFWGNEKYGCTCETKGYEHCMHPY
jgi:hypothetical protein